MWHFKRQTTMRKLLIILTLTFCLISCGQTRQNNAQTRNTSLISVDTSVIAVLPFDTTQTWIFKECKQESLSTTDFEIIDSLLTQCVDTYNKEQEIRYKENKPVKNYLLDLKTHKRQYIAVINDKGEREVWVNCFCRTWDRNWKKEIIMVEDGGVCYFNLKINLTNKKYYELMVNGIG
jgi:hypothetical protein